ncbi:hypothetical protein NO135_24175, partial [Clostridioides difficile]|nr:hypothetical protein [Clostridioides difficile]
IESNPRTLLQFLRLIESRLARNENWTAASVEAAFRSVADSTDSVGWDPAQRLRPRDECERRAAVQRAVLPRLGVVAH